LICDARGHASSTQEQHRCLPITGESLDTPVDVALYDWPGRAIGLSERQSEVLALLATGLSNKEVAQVLFLSPETVKDSCVRRSRRSGCAIGSKRRTSSRASARSALILSC
jgi:DNA-binding NarL/FixJ family response regulator